MFLYIYKSICLYVPICHLLPQPSSVVPGLDIFERQGLIVRERESVCVCVCVCENSLCFSDFETIHFCLIHFYKNNKESKLS